MMEWMYPSRCARQLRLAKCHEDDDPGRRQEPGAVHGSLIGDATHIQSGMYPTILRTAFHSLKRVHDETGTRRKPPDRAARICPVVRRECIVAATTASHGHPTMHRVRRHTSEEWNVVAAIRRLRVKKAAWAQNTPYLGEHERRLA
jgi:hypothetical protein